MYTSSDTENRPSCRAYDLTIGDTRANFLRKQLARASVIVIGDYCFVKNQKHYYGDQIRFASRTLRSKLVKFSEILLVKFFESQRTY